MRTVLKINIPEPCLEDWNLMTPKEKGRHCSLCEKTVFDFTSKTDEQIVKTFQSEGKLCGRFKSTQLNRELILSRKEKHNYLSFVASTLFAFLSLGTQEVEAQGKPQEIKVDNAKNNKVKRKIASSLFKQKEIVGIVTTKVDNLPLPGVSVKVKGTKRTTQTNFDGFYKIKANVGETLVFSYIDTFNEEHIISKKSSINMAMEFDESKFESIVLGYPSQSSYRKIARNKKKRIKKHLRQRIKDEKIKRTTAGKFLYNISNIFRRKE